MMVMPGLDARGLATRESVFSEQTKEEEPTMLRLRLASLALASSLLLLSGCSSLCEDGRMFPRLFNRSSSRPAMTEGVDCECHSSPWTKGVPMPMPLGQGPFPAPSMASNGTPPIPITNIPANQPPIFKVPQAPPTVYVPAN